MLPFDFIYWPLSTKPSIRIKQLKQSKKLSEIWKLWVKFDPLTTTFYFANFLFQICKDMLFHKFKGYKSNPHIYV